MIDIEKLASQDGTVFLESACIVWLRIPLAESLRISSGAVVAKDALLVRVSEGEAYG